MAISREGLSELFQYGLHAVNFLKDFSEKTPKEIKEKLPMFLGLSLEDERRWAGLWTQLSPEERESLTKFLKSLAEYERNHFRYVVVGIPSGEGRTTKTGTGKDAKAVTEPGQNLALEFIKALARTVQEEGPEKAKEQCKVGGSITDPFSKSVFEKWKAGNKWFEATVFPFIGITAWGQLPKKLREYDCALANRIEDARIKRNPQAIRGEVKDPRIRDIFTFRKK